MYKTEKILFNQLEKLKEEYNLQGVKAEFEAEGSSFKDLLRLRRLTSKLGIKLYLKIGGSEALRDIRDSLEIGVDGLIAPMIESKFSAKKFYMAYKKVYSDYNIHTSLNIETRIGVENIEDIVEYSKDKIDNITIGRSDLSASYFNKEIKPDTDFIYKIIQNVSSIVQPSGMTLTVGGNVSTKTIDEIKKNHQYLKDSVLKLETRKVMFLIGDFLENDNVINEAIKLEELYILSKKEYSDMYISSEIARLTELRRRAK